MKYLFISICFCLISSFSFSEIKIDSVLQKKIKMMFTEDQKWRREEINLQQGKKSSFDENSIEESMGKADSLNLIKAKIIINKYGFPGYSLVGIDGSDEFWAIVQHSDQDIAFQKKVVLLMSGAVKRHNASGDKFALLQDRVLVNEGRKQIYGTQVHVSTITHHASPFPIQDSVNVDARRKSVGLQSLEDYLKLFNK